MWLRVHRHLTVKAGAPCYSKKFQALYKELANKRNLYEKDKQKF
jgi:hypothetical protein